MAAAAAQVGGSLLSGVLSGKGAKSAAKIQAQAINNAVAAQQAQYDQTRSDLSPYTNAGVSSLQDQLRLLGVGDYAGQQQADALASLRSSPLFTGAYDTGKDAILQSAAATGGLRGGNVDNSLAQFGSGLFSQVLQNQLANLGGITSIGQNAAAGVANAGQQSTNAISGLLTQGGQNAALGIGRQTAAINGTINDLSSILRNNFGGASTSMPYSTGYSGSNPYALGLSDW